MMPASHIGKTNYELLGNQRVGETHQSRMNRVNAMNTNAPTLVGNIATPVHVNGSKPMGNTTYITDPVAYGVLGGLVGGALAHLYTAYHPSFDKMRGMTKKKKRNATAVSGIIGGAIGGYYGGRNDTPAWTEGLSNPYAGVGIGVIGAAVGLFSLTKMNQYKKTKVKDWKEALMMPSTLLLGIGIPAVIGAYVGDKRKDRVTGGLIGALAGAAMVALGHRALGVAYD